MVEAKRVPDREDMLTDDEIGARAEREASRRAFNLIEFEDGEIFFRSNPDDFRGDGALTIERDLHGVRALDHMIVGDEMAFIVPCKARARPLGDCEHIE